ncbi:MAG: endonuclease/exonuclease/phosphatase family protein [Candidatus Sumerlaeia bacterium]|nr:endonuclease/exonuclease/phosphatase family protein [Candidatus Sumerlaeia bacterium]
MSAAEGAGTLRATRSEAARRAVFAIYGVAAVVLATAYLFARDRFWWIEPLTVWPAFFWFVPLLPLAVAGTDRRNRRRVAVAAWLAVLLLVAGEEWRSLLRPRREVEGIRIATWNLGGSDGDPAAREAAIRAARPDLLAIQEAPADLDALAAWGALPHRAELGELAILSRYPILDESSHPLGRWAPAQRVRVDAPGAGPLVVWNGRYELPALRLDLWRPDAWRAWREAWRARRDAFEELAGLAARDAAAGPVAVAGDFNTPARSALLAPLRAAGLRDAWRRSGSGWGRTITAEFPSARIDAVWVGGGHAAAASWAFGDARCSDHLGVVAVLAPAQ